MMTPAEANRESRKKEGAGIMETKSSGKSRAELIAEMKETIMSLTDAECRLLLRAWKVREENPGLTAEECIARAEADTSGKGGTA